MFTTAGLPIFTDVFSCLPMFTRKTYVYQRLPYVYLCLLVFTCLPLFTRACLPMFTHRYLCLSMLTQVNSCLPTLTLV